MCTAGHVTSHMPSSVSVLVDPLRDQPESSHDKCVPQAVHVDVPVHFWGAHLAARAHAWLIALLIAYKPAIYTQHRTNN